MGLGGELFAKFEEESGLADSGFTDDEDHLAPPLARGVEGRGERLELVLATHVRCELGFGERLDTSADGTSPHHLVGLDRERLTLYLGRVQATEVEEAGDLSTTASEITTPPGGASGSRRAARFTVSPMAV